MIKRLHVQPAQVGNLMFRLMFAEYLRQRIPDAVITGAGIPEWGLSFPQEPPPTHVGLRGGHKIDVDALLADMPMVGGVILGCYAQRLEYFEHDRDSLKRWFMSPRRGHPTDADELVIHVRAEDVLRGVHPDYMPVPISYYRDLVQRTGLRPVFVGQTGASYYADALRRVFPDGRFLEHGYWLDDFQTIRHARTIGLSVSSFAWLAAWLSDTAQRIYQPQLGILNPLQRPEIDLAPVKDSRYVFQPFPVVQFSAQPRQIDWILHGSIDVPPEARPGA